MNALSLSTLNSMAVKRGRGGMPLLFSDSVFSEGAPSLPPSPSTIAEVLWSASCCAAQRSCTGWRLAAEGTLSAGLQVSERLARSRGPTASAIETRTLPCTCIHGGTWPLGPIALATLSRG